MKYEHILAQMTGATWAILPSKLEAVMGVVMHRATGGKLSAEEIRAALGGEPQPAPRPRTAGAIAILPLYGLLLPRADSLQESSGVMSLGRFQSQLKALLADDSIESIVLDIDSPGGQVGLVEETARMIYDARGQKRIIGMVNTLAASAAYWIASACDEVVITPSGEVGSIGCFMVHLDRSKANEEEGLNYSLFTAGKYKAEDNPFEPLDEEAKAAIQARVDESEASFVKAIARGRGVAVSVVRSDYGQGRVLSAQAAKAAGMVDRIATLDEVVAKLGGRRATSGRSVRAEAEPAAIPALVQGDQAAALESAPIMAAIPGIEIVRAGPGDTARAVEVVPTPAPQAKERPMSLDTGAAPSQGPDVNAAAFKAANERHAGIMAIAKTAKKDLAWVEKAYESGKSVDALRAEEFERLAALHKEADPLTPTARAELPNEAKRPFGSAEYLALHARVESGSLKRTDSAFKRAQAGAAGEYYDAIRAAYSPGGDVDPRLMAAATGMSQGVPAEGGFGVLPQFSNMIWDGLETDPNALLSLTDNYTIDGESLTFLANAETSRATGSRAGGVRGYWINEADQATKSKPTFRQVKLEPQEMVVLVYLTDKLIRNNSVGMGQYVNRKAIEEIGYLTGEAIVNGTGVGQPKGLLPGGVLGGSTVQVSKEGSQANTTFNKQNANKMWARLHPRSQANAVWLMNIDVSPQLDEFNTPIKNVAGTENVGGFGTQIYNADRNTLKGRPIIYTEFCGTLGALGDVILWDPKGYVAGIRGDGVRTDMSIHVRFEYAESAFRFMYEVDGQPWLAAAQTQKNGSNTLSTQVVLQAR